MRDRLETLETRNRQAQLTATRGGANLEEQLALYERHVMQLEQLIPASEEVPQLLRTINSEARRLNVEMATYQPEPEVPGPYYTETGYSIRAYGDYHDIGRFLTAIASLRRIITPTDLDLSRFTGSPSSAFEFEAPVVATFRIKTYVLPEGGAPAARMGGEAGT